jgi:hypothetical protein
VLSGAIQVGLINAEQLLDEVPAIAIPQRPFPLNFHAIVEAAADPDREMRPLIDKAVPSSCAAYCWSGVDLKALLTEEAFRARGFECAEVDDGSSSPHSALTISNKKVRVSGKRQAAFVEQCGGMPAIIN